jgi:hypothetical protein
MNLEDQTDIYKPEKGSDLALIACPFCGCEEVVYMSYNHASGKRWAAVCMGCIAQIDPGWAQQKHQVQELWNQRKAITQ